MKPWRPEERAAEIAAVLKEADAPQFLGRGEWIGRTHQICLWSGGTGNAPKEEDLNGARRAVALLKRTFTAARVSWEALDEWLDITIHFEPEYEIGEKGFTRIVEDVLKMLEEADQQPLQAVNGRTDGITTHRFPERGGRYRAELTVLLETPRNRSGRYEPTEIHVKVEGTPAKEEITCRIGEREFNADTVDGALEMLARSIRELPKGPFPVTPIPEEYAGPEWADDPNVKVLGFAGDETPWMECPFLYKEGRILHRDREGRWWRAANLESAANALADAYHPKIPDGATDVRRIAWAAGRALTKSLLKAAEYGRTDAFAAIGHRGMLKTIGKKTYLIPWEQKA